MVSSESLQIIEQLAGGSLNETRARAGLTMLWDGVRNHRGSWSLLFTSCQFCGSQIMHGSESRFLQVNRLSKEKSANARLRNSNRDLGRNANDWRFFIYRTL